MSTFPGPRTPTLQVRLLVLVLAAALPFGYGAYHRFLPDTDRPTPTSSSGERLVMAPLQPPSDPRYVFREYQPQSREPVAFDPCRAVHYVVRPDGAPQGGLALITGALADISAATGLQFVDDGTTDEAPSEARPNFLPDRYGDRWAPVLIAWSTPAEFEPLSGEVIGVAGNAPVATEDGQLALVSGQVVLDSDQLTDVLKFVSGRAVANATITHELGHLVGLAHVDDEQQLMFPSARPLVNTLGRGDLTGLATLGSGRCFDDL